MKSKIAIVLALLCCVAYSFAADADSAIKYHDGKPDGEDHVVGSTKMIRFTVPTDSLKLVGIRVHASKYEHAGGPENKILLNIRSSDAKTVLNEQTVPYSKFAKDKEDWVTIELTKPVDVPKTFWIELNDDATLYRGLKISYDTSTNGSSKIGDPKTGKPLGSSFKGDYMIELLPAAAAAKKSK